MRTAATFLPFFLTLALLNGCACPGSQTPCPETPASSADEPARTARPRTESRSKNGQLRVIGVLVAAPDIRVDDESFSAFDPLSVGTTEVVLWLESETKIAGISAHKSQVTLGDDTGACTGCDERGAWGSAPAKIGIGEKLTESGTAARFRLVGQGRPSPGATRIMAKGEVAVQVASEPTAETVTLDLASGGELVLGETTYKVKTRPRDDGWVSVGLSSPTPLNVREVVRVTAAGKDVEFREGLSGAWSQDDGPVSYELSLKFHTDAKQVELELSYVSGLEFISIPFDFEFGLDGVHEGPTDEGAWESRAF